MKYSKTRIPIASLPLRNDASKGTRMTVSNNITNTTQVHPISNVVLVMIYAFEQQVSVSVLSSGNERSSNTGL